MKIKNKKNKDQLKLVPFKILEKNGNPVQNLEMLLFVMINLKNNKTNNK